MNTLCYWGDVIADKIHHFRCWWRAPAREWAMMSSDVRRLVNAHLTRGLCYGMIIGLCLSVITMRYVPERGKIMVPSATWTTGLRNIGASVCAKNGGLKTVTLQNGDVYSFNCADGLSLRDTIVRLK